MALATLPRSVGPSWSDVAPLASRGALALGFALVALVLQVIAMLVPGVAGALLLLVFAAFLAVDAALTLGLLWVRRPVGARRAGLLLRGCLALAVTVALSSTVLELISPRGTDDFTMATGNALICWAFGAWVFG